MIITDYKTPCAPRSSEKAASIFIFHISYLGGTQRRSGARALANPALLVTTCPICVTNRALYMISSVEKQRYTFYLFWLRNETDTVVFIIRARSSSPNGCCCSAQAGLLGLFFGLACCSLLFCPPALSSFVKPPPMLVQISTLFKHFGSYVLSRSHPLGQLQCMPKTNRGQLQSNRDRCGMRIVGVRVKIDLCRRFDSWSWWVELNIVLPVWPSAGEGGCRVVLFFFFRRWSYMNDANIVRTGRWFCSTRAVRTIGTSAGAGLKYGANFLSMS